jgi:hypothetical protein
MKRALTTFGNPFGLALYDKEQHGVRGKAKNHRKPNGQTLSWILLSPEGEVISLHEDPADYCKALRQVIEAGSSPERLKALWTRNSVTIEMLRANLRDLRTEAGEHYAHILLSLYKGQLRELREEQGADQVEAGAVREVATAARADQQTDQAKAGAREVSAAADAPDSGNGDPGRPEAAQPLNGAASSNGQHYATVAGQVDKSALPISAPRRIRDKDHLRFVASRPCLVCGRSPGHAHHIRFAQPRALGRKVSDEWTVPLCATHHRSLHTVGDEQNWWKARAIDPIAHAEELWRGTWDKAVPITAKARELILPTPG